MSLTVYAPATMGNIGVGFDLLGAAVMPINGDLLGDKVTIKSQPSGVSLTLDGRWANRLPPTPEDNIVYQCGEFFLAQLGSDAGIAMKLEKNLPVGSGLGSSASSVVAALYGLNEYFERPYSQQALLRLMGEFEGKISGAIHFDNVAPCYLGGMQLMLGTKQLVCDSLPTFDNWYWVIAYPDVSLSTAKMRNLLPNSYDRSVLIDFGRHLSAFVHASYRQDAPLAIEVLKDVVAEPYRAAEIPGYSEACEALSQLGMLTSGISGSGPTLFSVTDDIDLAHKAQRWLDSHYVNEGMGFSHICQIDTQGARHVD